MVPDRVLAAYRGRSVLVTGAGGLIGGAVAHILAGVDCRLLRLARSPLPELPGAKAELVDVTADLSVPGDWRDLSGTADVVLHLAAQTSTYGARNDPAGDLAVNVGGLLSILDALRRAERPAGAALPHVVIAGTVTEAGMPMPLPVDETVEDRPLTFYDLSKLTAERYLKMHTAEGWVTGCCLRLPNVYGRGPGTSRADRGVLDKAVARAVAGEPLFVYGEGGWLRDYTHIDDVASAFIHAGACADAVNGRHFVIGTGVGTSVKASFELAIDATAAITRRRVALESRDPPDGLSPIEFRTFVADSRAFQQATGWRPRVELRAGLERLAESVTLPT